MTPICHTLPILFMGILGAITQQPVNMLSYMLVGIPVGVVIFLIMFAWFRYVVKPDISQFANVDFNVFDSKRPGPMGIHEKLFSSACWQRPLVLPGFLSFLAPQSAFRRLYE
jgi:hypothetical protein